MPGYDHIYKPVTDYRGVNWDAAETARDASYRNPHSIAWGDIPRHHRVDTSGAGILNALTEIAYSNPWGVNPDVNMGKSKPVFVTTSGMSRDMLQTLYGNIIPPATYLRRYNQHFDPRQNLFQRGIGNIKKSKTMQLLKLFLKYKLQGIM